jgi:hypothetical protein
MTESATGGTPSAAPEPPQSQPSGPGGRREILSRSSLLLELVIVTAGVLIALSVDTVRQWRAHESLADEARATMLAEVAQNKSALDEALTALGATRDTYTRVLGNARERLAGKPVEEGNVNLNFKPAVLSKAAYTTAEITGALGYMRYEDVRYLATVYEAQARFASLQDQLLLDIGEIVMPLMFGRDISDAGPQQLEEWARGLETLLARMLMLQGFGEGLRLAYAGVLSSQ